MMVIVKRARSLIMAEIAKTTQFQRAKKIKTEVIYIRIIINLTINQEAGMRTQGTLTDIYAAAKNYADNIDTDTTPLNPVVRRENGIWMLESELEPSLDNDFQCSLEEFDSYFYETYTDNDFVITHETEREFIENFGRAK